MSAPEEVAFDEEENGSSNGEKEEGV